MKIRTVEQLCDALNHELIWRKRELTDLKYSIERASQDSRRRVIARSGITILYAHWEGFIKTASQYYLEYISRENLKNSELQLNFLTISMFKSTGLKSFSKNISTYEMLTEFYISKMNENACIPYKSIIRTESNLSSKVLREIVWCLGLDYSIYETKENLIDINLLKRRNNIAHGEYIDIDPNDYIELRDNFILLMTTFRDQILNSASMKAYLIS